MREFRFVLGRRALIVFLALLVATGALLGVPATTRTLAESPPPGSQETAAASADPVAADEPLLGPSGYSPLLQAGGGFVWTLVPTTSQSPSAPTARCNHAMATTPSGVLLFGGWDGSGFLNDTWLFNPITSTWGLLDTGSASPTNRGNHAMAATPSGVLLFGGQGDGGIFLNDTWLFNTATNTWGLLDTGSASPTDRCNHAMATTPSGALLFGGQDDGGIFLNDTWLFNTATNTWGLLDTGSASPSRRHSHAMAATPSGVLLFGGHGVGHGVGYLNDTWLFNTATNTWGKLELTLTITAPSARYLHAMATTPSGVLLFGGQDGSGIFNDTWLFNTGTNSWGLLDTGSASPSGRFSHAMAATLSGVLLFGGDYDTYKLNDTWLYGPPPSIVVTSPTGNERWTIGTNRDITWTSTGLNSTTLTILLARNGVDFTETITKGLSSAINIYTWTVTGPGTINAKIRVQQDATEGTSPDYFTITSALFPYIGGTTTLTTSDPWLEISGGTDTGTLWVTPLDPQYTSDPDLSQFIQETGKRSALFFDIGQEGLSGTLTIVLHFTPQVGEETFVLYLWNGTGWVSVPGTLNLANHTFTFTIDAALLLGTPFALGGDPVAMPGMNPWGLALLSLSLLGMGGWWFLRRRGVA